MKWSPSQMGYKRGQARFETARICMKGSSNLQRNVIPEVSGPYKTCILSLGMCGSASFDNFENLVHLA